MNISVSCTTSLATRAPGRRAFCCPATPYGVASGGPGGKGIVFKVGIDGAGFTTLHCFAGSDGRGPGGLVLIGDTLFGGTFGGGGGGQKGDSGTIFGVRTDGSDFRNLHIFTGDFLASSYDGENPQGVVSDGNTLYGSTFSGGATNHQGTLFAINIDGTDYRILHSFDWFVGYPPSDGIILVGNRLIGQTVVGGNWGLGTILPSILMGPVLGCCTIFLATTERIQRAD